MANSSMDYPVLVDNDARQQHLLSLAPEQSGSGGSKDMLPGVDVVLPILGMILKSVGTLWSYSENRKQQDRQNAFEKELIHEQNMYNSPSAQLSRMLAAGVPYNTAMQSLAGAVVGNATQPMPGQSAPYTPVQDPSLQDSMSLIAAKDSHDLTQSQVKLNEAEAYSKSPDNPNNVAVRENLGAQTYFTNLSSEHELIRMGLTKAEIRVAQEQGRLLHNNADQALYDALIRGIDYSNYDDFKKLELGNLAASTGKTLAELWRIAVTTGQEINKMDAEAYAARALGRFHHSAADEKDMWNGAYKPYASRLAFGETMGKLFSTLGLINDYKAGKFDLRSKKFYSSKGYMLTQTIVDDVGKMAGAAMSIAVPFMRGKSASLGFSVGTSSSTGFGFSY